MIQASNLTKGFEKTSVLYDLNCEIKDGSIYGLVGANGAGKSTFLRLLMGIYYPEKGSIKVDGNEVFDNNEVKKNAVFLADELYFPPGATVKDMAKLYSTFYENFDHEIFKKRCELLKLPLDGKISAFSKGMRRQVSMLAALACKTKYKYFDETFDGLDPVVRNLIKRFIYEEVAEENNTVILTSHNLRELEDICDHLGVLYKGGILFQGDINSLKTNVFKIQIAFKENFEKEKFSEFEVLNFKKTGSIATVIIKGDKDELKSKLLMLNPIIFDMLPLTLEEIFIYEMEVLGYAFNEINI